MLEKGQERKQRKSKSHNVLTAREREVIAKLHEGKSYADAGKDLGVGVETIRKHATNIYAKLDVKNKMQAVRKYFG